MTTLATGRRGVVEIISDVAKSDEGTALLMVEMLAYDALCEEVDRIQPFLDRDVSRLVVKRATGALEHVAKRYAVAKSDYERAELEEMAGALYSIVTVAKEDGDVRGERWWEREQRIPAGQPHAGEWARDAAGRSLGGRTMRRITGALGLFTGQDKDTREVLGPALTQIKDSNRYDVARALGNGLQQINHPNARAAGTIARMTGDIGQEAARVFQPGLTRLAYRYRGTERRPNPQYDEVTQALVTRATDEAKNKNKPTDQARLRAVANAGAGFLWGSHSVPDQRLAELSLKAGKMPPSRGILFDAAGHPVSESVGFNGDHYLPFDLKNLKRLRGGQYVRTRTTGGLTDEDIYTGLLTGARQVTVVSNSGVFSIEFDPSLRGGRRYSDKARQMVERYAALLSTIKHGEKNELLVNDLSPREKAQLRQEANTRAKGNKTLSLQYYNDELDKERNRRRNQTLDDDELMDEARSEARAQLAQQQRAGQVKGVSERTLAQRTRDIFRDKKDAQRAQMVRYYRLDFDGYKAAQDALQQEFPYFIRSRQAVPLDEWLEQTNRLKPGDPLPPRPGIDIGYTRRNALAPGGAGSGNVEEEVAPTTAPAQRGGGDSAAARSETPTAAESAAWTDALADPGRKADLAHSLEKSLSYRRRVERGMEEPADINDDDERALGSGGEGYGLWILHKKRSPNGIAEFLLDPKTDEEHINKTIDAIEAIKPDIGAKKDPRWTEEDADRAIEQLNEIKLLRHPFAEPASNPLYAAPEEPQPFDDILPLVGNQEALDRYAEENEEFARQARAYLNDDEKARAAINADLAVVRSLERWPKDANGLVDPEKPPAGARITADEANLFLRPETKHDSPLYQSLERKQKGWALARAAHLTAAIDGTEVRVGPKEPVEMRDRSARRAQTGSRLVAKRRQPQSERQRLSSPSSLEAVLAKRLSEDPAYLEWLKSV